MPAFALRAAWAEARAPHVTVMSDVGGGAATDVARRLERLVQAMALVNPGLGASPRATTVVLLADTAQVRAYSSLAPAESPGGFGESGLDRDWIVLAADLHGDETRTEVLFREYVHLDLRAGFATLPAWLDEGLAAYYASVRVGDHWAEVGTADADLVRWARQQSPMSLDEMFAMSTQARAFRVRNPLQRSFQAQSWALVQYLESPVRGHAADFTRCLARLRQGAPARAAFADVIVPARWSDLPDTLHDYLDDVEFEPVRRVDFPGRGTEIPVRVRPLSTGEALGRLGTLLSGYGAARLDAARDHLRAAVVLDSTVAASWAAQGYVADLDGDAVGAERAYAKSLALAPGDAGPALWAGLGTLERARRLARANPRADALPGLVLAARDRLRACLRMAPDDAEALAAYGRSFAMRGEADSSAVSALLSALALQPGRRDVAADLETVRAAARPRGRALATAEPEAPTVVRLPVVKRAPERAGTTTRSDEFPTLYNRAARAMNSGDAEQALDWLQKARTVARDRQDLLYAGRAIVRVKGWIAARDAHAALEAGRLDDAHRILAEALALPLPAADRTRLEALDREVDARRADGRPR